MTLAATVQAQPLQSGNHARSLGLNPRGWPSGSVGYFLFDGFGLLMVK
jgi:hypothetical protein